MRALALGLLVALWITPSHGAERRVALVIGNAAYADASLRTPVHDARAVAETLRGLGFAVTEIEDAGQKAMNRAIISFADQLEHATAGLFYYAGHGLQIKGRNYLVPVDAEMASEIGARVETIELDAILEAMSAGSDRLNLVILDAAYGHPFERRQADGPHGLAQVQAAPGMLIAYPTRPGKVVVESPAADSLYTTTLRQAMTEPGLPIESVFKRVRAAIARATDDRQLPWEASALTADFVFAPALDEAAELAAWSVLPGHADARDLQAFLDRFPHGWFAPLARSRLGALAVAAASPPVVARVGNPVDGRWNIKLYGCGNGLTYTLVDVAVADGRLVGRSHDPVSRAAWDLTLEMVRPDEVAIRGRVSSYIGYTGNWESAGTLKDRQYKGFGRHPFWHGIGCFFEADRR